MLSAQTTDVNVNKVTERLFVKYRRPEDYLAVPPEELERDIYQTGFFRQKTKSLRGTMAMLLEEFDGEVPRTIEELTRLPGVARKTANVVAAELGNPQGIVVDTHVRRLSQRLGLTKQDDPVKIERDLTKLVPRRDWGLFPHLLIWHGRRVCIARAPRCEDCVLNDLCPSSRVSEYSSACGRSSVISNHGAFEPTKMWSVGRMLGSSSSEPDRDVHVLAVADDRVEKGAADAAARVVLPVVAPDEQRVGALDDLEPVALDPGERLERRAGRGRQFEQWQLPAYTELVPPRGSATSLHSQRPLSIASVRPAPVDMSPPCG